MDNLSRLKNHKAIVTGGSSGNGLAIAGRLRTEGATVALLDLDPMTFTGLTAELGAGHHLLQVDVTGEAQANTAVVKLAAQWGGVDVLVNSAGMVSYSSSKAAVIGMTKSQGKEYAETGVTINALAPAVIQTTLVDAMPPDQVKANTDKIPMNRGGTLDEAAVMAAFIVSRESSFTTGFTFDLSRGRAVY